MNINIASLKYEMKKIVVINNTQKSTIFDMRLVLWKKTICNCSCFVVYRVLLFLHACHTHSKRLLTALHGCTYQLAFSIGHKTPVLGWTGFGTDTLSENITTKLRQLTISRSLLWDSNNMTMSQSLKNNKKWLICHWVHLECKTGLWCWFKWNS